MHLSPLISASLITLLVVTRQTALLSHCTADSSSLPPVITTLTYTAYSHRFFLSSLESHSRPLTHIRPVHSVCEYNWIVSVTRGNRLLVFRCARLMITTWMIWVIFWDCSATETDPWSKFRVEGADKEIWVASHTKGFNDLGQGNIMSALIEIEDAVLTTIRRVIGFYLVRVAIYLNDSGWDGKVILIRRAAVWVNEF